MPENKEGCCKKEDCRKGENCHKDKEILGRDDLTKENMAEERSKGLTPLEIKMKYNI